MAVFFLGGSALANEVRLGAQIARQTTALFQLSSAHPAYAVGGVWWLADYGGVSAQAGHWDARLSDDYTLSSWSANAGLRARLRLADGAFEVFAGGARTLHRLQLDIEGLQYRDSETVQGRLMSVGLSASIGRGLWLEASIAWQTLEGARFTYHEAMEHREVTARDLALSVTTTL
jgi:hypothetical protein